ncbi:DUF4435 domain-containing protein [Providencia rettgeri]|uniref:DUF4435 domain-containing protein n=1 Tax=Providencia rettgeri TaxID=587 RepID=UPI0013943900|nr:DUF4435 domain-containing protein [Providencia rettgeri]MRF66076.1 DUF4435 domain-containing protein [Escherichia coli]
MSSSKVKPTIDELFALLKNTSIPTVLVEGKDDIILYRRIEDDLDDIGIDMLPAGNKDAVLELRRRINSDPILAPVAFVVDKDLWVHFGGNEELPDVITTEGYSIENDIFIDGELLNLMDRNEIESFHAELYKFIHWYALAVTRSRNGGSQSYRESPHKVLDDSVFYDEATQLAEYEAYPQEFFNSIYNHYGSHLRGKSLFAMLVRQLSNSERRTKFSVHQLMEIGASRKGERYNKIKERIRELFIESETA